MAQRASELRGDTVRPPLRLVQTVAPEPRRLDPITRESHVRLILSLSRLYQSFGIDVIVNQALLGKSSVDQLPDDELVDLLKAIERARECIADDVSFEEAGLLRTSYATR